MLDYPYFTNYYTMMAMELAEKHAIDADPKAIQQTNFTVNLDQNANTTMFNTIPERK